MKKLVVLFALGSVLAAGCNSNSGYKKAPKPVDDAQQIQNDPSLSPQMKARLLRQVGSNSANPPGTKATGQ